jgi:serine protease AprX
MVFSVPFHYPSARSTSARAAALIAFVVGSVLTLSGSGAGHRAHLSFELLSHEARRTSGRVRVIVHGAPDEMAALAARHHLSIVRQLTDSAVVTVNSSELSELAADSSVDHLSGDLRVHLQMSVSNISTAADKVRAGKPGLLLGIGAIAGVTGQGIGVAVIDSGVSPHKALPNVVANVSFVTGHPSVVDEFGHGTHVAGIVAGNGAAAAKVTSLFTGGIAPGAQIINVRVLGPDGTGLTSDVIAGIDWAIANRTRYNIRVINLSLGHPVTEPSATDPLCEEVLKATQAGIVVVASAGNSGKMPDGRPILGGISSPGNSPWAITVGALNTWETNGRSDDSVTTYSSRGPTRYDLAVKPDVVAPGNKIVSLEASNSYLAASYSFLHVAGSSTNAYCRLSGTSMSAPMVSGAVALLLQGSPNLSAAQIKLALQSGATYLPDAGLMGGGAGSVDFWQARQTTASGLTSLLSRLIGSILGPSGAAYWDANGTLSSRLYAGTGLRLLSILELPLAFLNPLSVLHQGDLNLLSVLSPLDHIPANPMLWGQVASWSSSQQILWGDTITDPQGQQILWGDSQTSDDYQILWGDSVLTSADPR